MRKLIVGLILVYIMAAGVGCAAVPVPAQIPASEPPRAPAAAGEAVQEDVTSAWRGGTQRTLRPATPNG